MIIGSLLEQIDTPKITFSGIKKALEKAPNPNDSELQERLNKLQNYNDEGKNLPSLPPSGLLPPPSGGFPPIPPPSNYNNNINNYNGDDDDNIPPSPSFFQYYSQMPPSNNIPQAPLVFTPPQNSTCGYVVLEKAQEKPPLPDTAVLDNLISTEVPLAPLSLLTIEIRM